jgi:DNA recombination protein RmuC
MSDSSLLLVLGAALLAAGIGAVLGATLARRPVGHDGVDRPDGTPSGEGAAPPLAHQVAEVRTELARMEALVGELHRRGEGRHHEVVRAIAEAGRHTASLTQTTDALREALAGSRSRGQWGERMADDVLRRAGLVEGVSYRRQLTLPGGGRPDVTFLLPGDRHLHMDVKFPLDNYLRHLDAADEAAAEAARAAFCRDVRARVREVATRDYTDPATTVGWMVLFIPNEAVYAFVHQHDPELLDRALALKVVLCSPLTLFAVLAVVRQAVDTFHLERTSGEILECLGRFSGQWDSFVEVLERLGNQLGTVQRTFDQLQGTRRRQLERQLDEVDRLRLERKGPPPVEPAGVPDADVPAVRSA